MLRIVLLSLGIVIVLLGMMLGPLPGPFGLPVVVIGLVIILRNSPWARKIYVRASRRWPWVFHLPNKVIRRRKPVNGAAAPENAA